MKNDTPFATYIYHQVGSEENAPVIVNTHKPLSNLVLITFYVLLFSGNHYMLVLTAKDYLRELGVSRVYVGLLNSLTPLSGFFFGIVCAFWTNTSYKRPMIMSILSLIVGNLVFGLALVVRAHELLFLGRFLLGIGGSGIIPKKYMTENLSMGNRTRWSAGLVMANAMGMASGPFFIVFLQFIDFRVFVLHLNYLSVPPAMWIVTFTGLLVVVVLLFEDPKHESSLYGGSSYPQNFSYLGVGVCAWMLVFSSGLQESFMSATPVTTYFDFDWDLSTTGLVVALLCVASLPAHFLTGSLAFKVSERSFILVSCILTIISTGMFFDLFTESETVFVLGAILMFLTTDVIEGASNALLSVKIPKKLFRGYGSSGFASNQSVLIGKVLGSLGVTLGSLRHLETAKFYLSISWCALGVFSLIAVLSCYKGLADKRKKSK